MKPYIHLTNNLAEKNFKPIINPKKLGLIAFIKVNYK